MNWNQQGRDRHVTTHAVRSKTILSVVVLLALGGLPLEPPQAGKEAFVKEKQIGILTGASGKPEIPLSAKAIPGTSSRSVLAQQTADWVVPYGKEFWRRAATPTSKTTIQPSLPGGGLTAKVDLADVIERVSHAIPRARPSADSRLQARTYTVTLQEDGMRFSPHGSGAEAHLRTIAIRQGGRTLYDGNVSGQARAVLGNTAQVLLNNEAGLIEHYEMRSEGIELAWVLSRRPIETSPVEVEFALTGLAYAGASTQGHHFADAAGTARVRVGQAMLVDARGSKQDLPIQAVGGRLFLLVPTAMLEGAVFPVAIDPLISAEIGMDNPVAGAVARGQSNPKVASNGEDYLVVWEDGRTGAGSDIFGTRMTRDGVVLDVGGLALSRAAHDQVAPAVASNGHDYLVVWVNNASSPYGQPGQIYGARVTSEGAVLEPDGFVISTTTTVAKTPAVASDGNGYLVVWSDGRIFGAFVSSEGIVSSGAGLPISPSTGWVPSVANNGQDYFVVWNLQNTLSTIQGARVSPGGVVLDPIPLTITSNPGGSPAVASDGQNFLVVWTGNTYPNYDIYAARVTGAGMLLDSHPFTLGNAVSDEISSAVASGGDGYFVVWRDLTVNAIVGSRVTSAGQILDPGGIRCSTAGSPDNFGSFSPGVAGNADGYLVAWGRITSAYPDISGTLVTTAGVAVNTNGLAIGLAANNQELPRVASNGDNYLVVWEDYRDPSGTTDIYGVRLSRMGEVLDPAGLAISTAVNRQFTPAVASDGRDYLVAWSDDRGGASMVYCTPITSDGVVLATNGIAVDAAASSSQNPALASNGENYFVAWDDTRRIVTNEGIFDVYAVRGRLVGRNGAVLDTNSFSISASLPSYSPGNFTPSVASNGRDYLVVWAGYRDPSRERNIYGARVNRGGLLLDVSPLRINESTNQQFNPVVASDGQDYFVAWQDLRNVFNYDLFGAQVSSLGVIPDPSGQLLVSAAGFPALASNGDEYLLAWQSFQAADPYTTYAARLRNDGTSADPAPFPITASLVGQGNPVLANNGKDFLIVYHRPDDTGVLRVGAKLFLDWESQDIGLVETPGGANLVPASVIVDGSGAGIGGTLDSFHFLWQPLNGNGQITARVAGFDADDPLAKAGVMIREDLSPDSRHAFMAVLRPPRGAAFERRVRTGEASFQTEVGGAAWLRLVRLDNTFIGYLSDDGVNWDLVWFTTLDLPAEAKIGLAVTAHGNAVPTPAVFDHVSVSPLTAPTITESLTEIHLGGEPAGANGSAPMGGLKLLITGQLGSYIIEAAADLGVWLPVGEVTNTYGAVAFLDGAAASHPRRFYRARTGETGPLGPSLRH